MGILVHKVSNIGTFFLKQSLTILEPLSPFPISLIGSILSRDKNILDLLLKVFDFSYSFKQLEFIIPTSLFFAIEGLAIYRNFSIIIFIRFIIIKYNITPLI